MLSQKKLFPRKYVPMSGDILGLYQNKLMESIE